MQNVQKFVFKDISVEKALAAAKEFVGKKHEVLDIRTNGVISNEEKFEGEIIIKADDPSALWAMRGYSIQYQHSL